MYQTSGISFLLGLRRSDKARAGAASVGRTVVALGLTSFFTDVSSEMVSTVLPLYVVYTLELSPAHLGAVDGVYQGAAALSGIAAALGADRLRRPKEIAFSGYALSALCKLGMFFICPTAAWLTAWLVMDRLGKGVRSAPRDAMIAQSVNAEQLGLAFGVHRALDTAGAMLGPLVAFALLRLVPQGFDLIFAASFCFAALGVLTILFFVNNTPSTAMERPRTPGTRDVTDEGVDSSLAERSFEHGEARSGCEDNDAANDAAVELARSLRRDLASLTARPFLATMAIGTVLGVGTVGDGLIFVVLQRQCGFAVSYVPLFYVASAMVCMVLAIPVGHLSDRLGRLPLFLFSHALLAALYLVLGMAGSTGPVWCTATVTLLLHGLFGAGTDGVIMAIASPLAPVGSRATALAFLSTSTSMARLFASAGFGLLWASFGLETALGVAVLTLVVALSAAVLGSRTLEASSCPSLLVPNAHRTP